MMTVLSRRFLAVFILAFLLLPSCATTDLTSVWRDDAYQGHPRKILVIGMLKTPGNRRILEDEMVKQLKARSTDAVAAYTVLPDGAGMNRETITAKMNELGADAVLISRLTDKKSVTTYVPGTGRTPYAGYGGGWHSYYSYDPGYVVEDEFAVVQTNLYDLKTDKLIWTAASETWMRDNSEQTIRAFTKVISKRLADQKVIAAGPAK